MSGNKNLMGWVWLAFFVFSLFLSFPAQARAAEVTIYQAPTGTLPCDLIYPGGQWLWYLDGASYLVKMDLQGPLSTTTFILSPTTESVTKYHEAITMSGAVSINHTDTTLTPTTTNCSTSPWGMGFSAFPLDVSYYGSDFLILHKDRLWWAETGGLDGIYSFDPATGNITYWQLPPGSAPYRIRSDGKYLWFSEYNAGKVARFDSATNQLREWSVGGHPVISDVDSNGRVWITDGHNSGVLYLSQGTTADFIAFPNFPSFSINSNYGSWDILQGPGDTRWLPIAELSTTHYGVIVRMNGYQSYDYWYTPAHSEPWKLAMDSNKNVWFNFGYGTTVYMQLETFREVYDLSGHVVGGLSIDPMDNV
ncbi:MAG: hypothetical protein JRI51_09695 [Deltaproteobacteria bacterium]|nr:hypothetical protein [Deltaproteobacteria bacterium]